MAGLIQRRCDVIVATAAAAVDSAATRAPGIRFVSLSTNSASHANVTALGPAAPGLDASIADVVCPLTPRELDVSRLADYVTPVAVIARRTHLSPGTVRNHLTSAVQKLGVTSRAEAVRTARDNGWMWPVDGLRSATTAPARRIPSMERNLRLS